MARVRVIKHVYKPYIVRVRVWDFDEIPPNIITNEKVDFGEMDAALSYISTVLKYMEERGYVCRKVTEKVHICRSNGKRAFIIFEGGF